MKKIGPVLWYSLAGGEPFIRSDLEYLIQDVQKHCRPKVFFSYKWMVYRKNIQHCAKNSSKIRKR